MAHGPPDTGEDLPGRKDLPDYYDARMDGLPVFSGSVDPLQSKGVDNDDGTRDPIGWIVHTLCRRLSNARQDVGRALERCQRSLGKIGDALSAIDRRARKIIEDRSTDPDQVMKEVALVHYAEFCGYRVNHTESPEDFVVMEKDDDKILLARDEQGRDLYFSLIHSEDRGSFSDFVRKKKTLSIGEVRKRMRERKEKEDQTSTSPLPSVSREWIEKTVEAFRLLRPYSGSVLESRWGLFPETVERFRGQIREDDKGSICFLHRNYKGVTGWEVLGEAQTRFFEWGTQSFFLGKTGKTITRVVITQTALEAMSYFQVRGKEGDCYLSLGGTISRKQLDSLRKVGQRFRPVVMATGGDERGMRLAEEIEREVPGLLQELPSSGRTWNEEIQEERGHSESDAFYRINP